MNHRVCVFMASALLSMSASCLFAKEQTLPYKQSVEQWRKDAEASLRKDNGWLTLAGRYVLKPGNSSIGCGEGFEVKFPEGTCPEGDNAVGFVTVGESEGKDGKPTVTLTSTTAHPWSKDSAAFAERAMGTGTDKRDWVTLGRLSMHFINRDGKIVLRLADNQNELRKNFAGRVWFDVKDNYKVKARYVPSKPGTKIAIIDVLGDIHDEASPGSIEFTLKGKTYKIDAVAEAGDDELFIIMKDGTSGNETYGAARFMVVKAPKDLSKTAQVDIDFNKAYNPPCAFSAYTTCPLPPSQNQLAVKIEAGEKYRAVK
jgi:uncharacterized protein